jgi:hypothetical protein
MQHNCENSKKMQENPRKITRTKNNLTRTLRTKIPNFRGTSPWEITSHPAAIAKVAPLKKETRNKLTKETLHNKKQMNYQEPENTHRGI